MYQRINYSNANTKIRKLFRDEDLTFSRKIMESVLNFLAKIHIYEEEENKIIPEIIFGKGLTNGLFKSMFQCDIIVISQTKPNRFNIEKALKPIVPFCDNSWRIFVNIESDIISVGIMRSFSGPTAISLSDNLQNPIDPQNVDFRYILIDVLSKYEIKMYTSSGKSLEIDYRFIYTEGKDRDRLLHDMIDDILSESLPIDDKLDEQKNALGSAILSWTEKIRSC